MSNHVEPETAAGSVVAESGEVECEVAGNVGRTAGATGARQANEVGVVTGGGANRTNRINRAR